MSESVVLYEEQGSVAIITLKRPDKMNTLTEGVVQGVADSIDRATASRPVRSIVLRGQYAYNKLFIRNSAALSSGLLSQRNQCDCLRLLQM